MDVAGSRIVHQLTAWSRQCRISLGRRGLPATLGLAARAAMGVLTLRKRRRLRRERAFDRLYNVQTAGTISLAALEFDGQNWEHGHCYMAADPAFVQAMLAALPFDVHGCTFVDFGSGKGRVLLLASELPFDRIIGVEFSRSLHATAQRNIQSFRSDRQVCRHIESVCADATTFRIPPEPVVLFFYNPFEPAIARQVLANAARSLAEHPRKMFLLLLNCSWRDAALLAGFRPLAYEVPGVPGATLYEAR